MQQLAAFSCRDVPRHLSNACATEAKQIGGSGGVGCDRSMVP